MLSPKVVGRTINIHVSIVVRVLAAVNVKCKVDAVGYTPADGEGNGIVGESISLPWGGQYPPIKIKSQPQHGHKPYWYALNTGDY